MVNANNPGNYKVIILGLAVTLFGIYIKQFFVHNMVIELGGWAITIIGALICFGSVFRILED